MIATYGNAHSADNPLWLGSIKSNIGHTQAAAGAAGIIKMVQAINHDVLPPTLHVDRTQPAHRLVGGHGTATHRTHPLARNRPPPHRGGVLVRHQRHQRAPDPPTSPTRTGGPGCCPAGPGGEPAADLAGLRAHPHALAAQAQRLHQHLAAHPDLDLTDVAYSLATTRTHHPYRAAITVPADSDDARRDLLETLGALGSDRPHPGVLRHHVAGRGGKTVFVFPGQGAQYPGMGRQLYQHHPLFAATLDEVCAALDPHLEVPLREVMFAEPHSAYAELVYQTVYAQPALFAWGVACTRS